MQKLRQEFESRSGKSGSDLPPEIRDAITRFKETEEEMSRLRDQENKLQFDRIELMYEARNADEKNDLKKLHKQDLKQKLKAQSNFLKQEEDVRMKEANDKHAYDMKEANDKY